MIDYFAFEQTSLATAIVASGGYEDDEDHKDRLWYTGQGGNDLCGNRRQIASQKLESGNKALLVRSHVQYL